MGLAVIDARQRGRISAEGAYAAGQIGTRGQIAHSGKLQKEIKKEEW